MDQRWGSIVQYIHAHAYIYTERSWRGLVGLVVLVQSLSWSGVLGGGGFR